MHDLTLKLFQPLVETNTDQTSSSLTQFDHNRLQFSVLFHRYLDISDVLVFSDVKNIKTHLFHFTVMNMAACVQMYLWLCSPS